MEPMSERSKRVAALAGRLRTLQAQLADEPDDVRQEQMSAELDRAFAGVVPQDRAEFVHELLTWFPAAEDGVATAGPVVRRAEGPKDAAAWAEGLINALASANEQERAAIVHRLTEAGVAPKAEPSVGLVESVEKDLKAKLQLGPAEKLDPRRVQELAVLLTEFVVKLDRPVWGTWTQRLAPPMSEVKSNGPLMRFIAMFVQGGADVKMPGLGLGHELQRLLQMTVAMISGVAQAGKGLAERWVTQISPTSIEENVGPGTGFIRDQRPAYWEEYKKRAATLGPDQIDREVTTAVAKSVEQWMKNMVR